MNEVRIEFFDEGEWFLNYQKNRILKDVVLLRNVMSISQEVCRTSGIEDQLKEILFRSAMTPNDAMDIYSKSNIIYYIKYSNRKKSVWKYYKKRGKWDKMS